MSNLIVSKNSQIREFESDFSQAKTLENFNEEKGFSAPQKHSNFSKEINSKKNDFNCKQWKILKAQK